MFFILTPHTSRRFLYLFLCLQLRFFHNVSYTLHVSFRKEYVWFLTVIYDVKIATDLQYLYLIHLLRLSLNASRHLLVKNSSDLSQPWGGLLSGMCFFINSILISAVLEIFTI